MVKAASSQEWRQIKHLAQIAESTLNVASGIAETKRLSENNICNHVVGEVLGPNGEVTFFPCLSEILVESSDEILDDGIEVLLTLEDSGHAVILGNSTTAESVGFDVTLNSKVEETVGEGDIVPFQASILVNLIKRKMLRWKNVHVALGIDIFTVRVDFRNIFRVPDRDFVRSNTNYVSILAVEVGQVVVVVALAHGVPESPQRRARSKPRTRNVPEWCVIANPMHALSQASQTNN